MTGKPRYRAVLFDVDGTLYRQDRLRLAMAAELGLASLGGLRTARIIREYRHAHEALRALGEAQAPLAATQLARTAERVGVTPDQVLASVTEWMGRRPLKYLRWCRRPGLEAALEALAAAGIRCGVLSDYPADAKIEALGLSGRFDIRLCSTDPGINALKPHPRGFLAACARWDLRPAEVLYVGDRPEVDGQGAVAAGLACAIVGHGRRSASEAGGSPWVHIGDFRELEGLCIT